MPIAPIVAEQDDEQTESDLGMITGCMRVRHCAEEIKAVLQGYSFTSGTLEAMQVEDVLTELEDNITALLAASEESILTNAEKKAQERKTTPPKPLTSTEKKTVPREEYGTS